MEKTTEILKICPFCGNDSFSEQDPKAIRVKEQERSSRAYGIPEKEPFTVCFVRCGRCGAQSAHISTGVNPWTDVYIDKEEARRIVVARWNRRDGENPN